MHAVLSIASHWCREIDRCLSVGLQPVAGLPSAALVQVGSFMSPGYLLPTFACPLLLLPPPPPLTSCLTRADVHQWS